MEKAVGQREKGEQTPLKRSPATADRGHARVTPVSTGHFRTGFCNDAYGIQSQHADAVMWFYSSCLASSQDKVWLSGAQALAILICEVSEINGSEDPHVRHEYSADRRRGCGSEGQRVV